MTSSPRVAPRPSANGTPPRARAAQRGSIAPLLAALASAMLAAPRAALAQSPDAPPPPAAPSADPPPGPAPAAPPPAAASTPASESPASESPAPGEAGGWIPPPDNYLQDAAAESALGASGPVDRDTVGAALAGLEDVSGLSGATGLMRVQSANPGAPGTFRLSLLTGFFSGSEFLCPECPDSAGDGSSSADEVDRVSANFLVSATLTDYLELYGGLFSNSTSTTRPAPQLKQVVGDWSLGVKGTLLGPRPGRIFTAGAALELGFATGSGQVGLSGIDSVDLGLEALASVDLNELPSRPIPVRFHANLGYLFDNSSKLVEEYEGNVRYVDRVERFSLGIQRVDTVPIGLGVEGTFEAVHPYVEWTIDIPANRQGWVCDRALLQSGDGCLEENSTFAFTPSRLTVGARAIPWKMVPWWLDGVAVSGAVDIGTGAVSNFLAEITPEAPWTLWLGVSFASTTKPKVEIRQVAAPAPLPDQDTLRVHGIVVEKETDTAIPDALIRFDGRNLTGMISTAEGAFRTAPLEPGLYTLRINAEGYREGLCSVEVLEALPEDPVAQPAPAGLSSPNAPEALEEPGLRCELEPLPKLSNVNGRVIDSASGAPVGTATTQVTDVLGRSLELQVDEVGAFRFQNVPPGETRITVRAPGYLTSVIEMNLEAPAEVDRVLSLTPIPSNPNVRLEGGKLRLKRPLLFAAGSSELSPDAMALIQELALLLSENPEVRVEVQGHASGAVPAQRELGEQRANTVRDALVLHGVPSGQLTAQGYAGQQPAQPGGPPDAQQQSDRVTFAIVEAEAETPLPF